MKKYIAIFLAACLCIGGFAGCSKQTETVTIYSSSEDFRNEAARKMLNERFPDYEINLVDMDTGTLAAKIAAEGSKTDADIILELESTYLEKVSGSLATLDMVDFSVYEESLVPENHKYVPYYLNSGAIIVDTKALAEKGVPVPTNYDDLLKPEYKGLLSMPNPKSSGTGYIFLLNMVNERGEEAAFAYFDRFAENISGQGFTTSGSGPVKALVTGEAAIGLGMTFQAVQSINEGSDFEILFFEEGAPWSSYSSAVVAGRETNKAVMEVFDYIVSEITPMDKQLYAPEKIYKDQEITMEHFPKEIPYGEMEGIRDIALKERLLDQWNH